jgi:DNA-directed RNA polymerase specialized sigma24 family protein
VTPEVNEVLLRSLTPSVLGILVRRGADFAAAEDAVQDALVSARKINKGKRLGKERKAAARDICTLDRPGPHGWVG